MANPDYLSDFVYCKVATAVTSTSTTSIVVDDVSLFPSNTILAKSNYLIVLESPLTYPNTFEICQLTNVNSGTLTLTVVRGQEGTAGATHIVNTYIKGCLSSGMVRRARAGFNGTAVPSTDSDLYITGDRFFKTDDRTFWTYITGTGFVPELNGRVTATATTSSLANGAIDSSTTITLGKAFRLYTIETDQPARVELYTTAAALTADSARGIGTDPISSAGVVLDYVTTVGGTVYGLSPLVDGCNLEGTPSKVISMAVTNLSGSTHAITVTLVFVATE